MRPDPLASLMVTATTAAAQIWCRWASVRRRPTSLAGASRDGIMPGPVRLSDLRDQTVVIAFFYRARTKG
jgi:hypothetical protein